MPRDIQDIVVLGYGTWSDITALPTLGFGFGAAVNIVYGPVRLEKAAVYTRGVQAGAAYVPGNQKGP